MHREYRWTIAPWRIASAGLFTTRIGDQAMIVAIHMARELVVEIQGTTRQNNERTGNGGKTRLTTVSEQAQKRPRELSRGLFFYPPALFLVQLVAQRKRLRRGRDKAKRRENA
jgi:hypothetical protein